PERLEALRKEIQEILPKQSAAVTNTEKYATFREHLLTLAPPPKPSSSKPTLRIPSPQRLNGKWR
ncbi:MAG TPA: hypothetical protein VFM77_12665, partial [Terriglobales bacterium]|nr:hypothetical protein [Terriglobales bacterium]